MSLVKPFGQLSHRGVDQGAGGSILRGFGRRGWIDFPENALGPVLDLLFLVSVLLPSLPQHFAESRLVVAGNRRKIRTSHIGLLIRRQKQVQRPSPLPVHDDQGVHVNSIDFRPLLPVDFDVHESFVHQTGKVSVVETFAGHDMAPVACGIPDAQENGLVLPPGLIQSLRSPWIPVHRLVGVLEQIGAGFLGQPVTVFGRCHLNAKPLIEVLLKRWVPKAYRIWGNE